MSEQGKYQKGNKRKEVVARNANFVLLLTKEKQVFIWITLNI